MSQYSAEEKNLMYNYVREHSVKPATPPELFLVSALEIGAYSMLIINISRTHYLILTCS